MRGRPLPLRLSPMTASMICEHLIEWRDARSAYGRWPAWLGRKLRIVQMVFHADKQKFSVVLEAQ